MQGDVRAGPMLTSLASWPSAPASQRLPCQDRSATICGLRTTGFERRATIAYVVTANAVLIEGIYGGQDFEAAFRRQVTVNRGLCRPRKRQRFRLTAGR